MLVAIIADLHGNRVALDAVLEDIELQSVDTIVCLGDVAATGPLPRETVERLRGLGCPVVMGNADAELLGSISDGDSEEMRRIVEIDRWCAAQLPPEHLDYLRGFDSTIRLDLSDQHKLLCCHGSPLSFDDEITSTTSKEDLDLMLSGCDATVVAGGHTHAQLVRSHENITFLNPGSVGLNPPVTEYALVASENGRLRIELRRLPLPLEMIRRSAFESGMPHAEWWAGLW